MFDTDSNPIGIDNRCSACISHCLDDFVDPPVPTDRIIKGFGGSRTSNVQTGTIKWKWEDDNGQVIEHIIPNSYYAPQAGVRLLSPQHWLNSILTPREKAHHLGSCVTFHNQVLMKWPGHTKTIVIDPHSNVATFRLAPDYTSYHAFCAEAEVDDAIDEFEPMCFETRSEDSSTLLDYKPYTRPGPVKVTFKLEVPEQVPDVSPEPLEVAPRSVASEFLHYHHKYGHISPKRIQGTQRHATSSSGNMPNPRLYGLSLWQSNQASLA